MNPNQLDNLIPIYTRSQPIMTDEIKNSRNDPSILLRNHQDVCCIINAEYQRGGIDTRDFAKSVFGTSLGNKIPVPSCNGEREWEKIMPEDFKKLGKDCPMLTYLDSCK